MNAPPPFYLFTLLGLADRWPSDTVGGRRRRRHCCCCWCSNMLCIRNKQSPAHSAGALYSQHIHCSGISRVNASHTTQKRRLLWLLLLRYADDVVQMSAHFSATQHAPQMTTTIFSYNPTQAVVCLFPLYSYKEKRKKNY